MNNKSNTSIFRRVTSVGVLCIALLGSVVFLTGCTQNETRVSDAWLRAKYTERLLATLKESQFAGDAETGVTGGADVELVPENIIRKSVTMTKRNA